MSVKSTLELVLYLLFNIQTLDKTYLILSYPPIVEGESNPGFNDMNVNSVKFFFENVANFARKKKTLYGSF